MLTPIKIDTSTLWSISTDEEKTRYQVVSNIDLDKRVKCSNGGSFESKPRSGESILLLGPSYYPLAIKEINSTSNRNRGLRIENTNLIAVL